MSHDSTGNSVDPVAARSTFLCTYMSNHPDTLLAYILQQEGAKAKNASSPSLQSITSKEMTLQYEISGQRTTTIVKFDPPLAGYEEVRPRLLAMKTQAEEAINMPKRPVINEYSWSKWNNVTLALVFFLIFSSLPLDFPFLDHSILKHAHQIRAMTGGWTAIKLAWAFTGLIHGLVALYVVRLTRIHSTPQPVKGYWILSALVLGNPPMLRFRQMVIGKRIASARKHL